MGLLVAAKVVLLEAVASGDGYGLELMERVEEASGGKIKLHQGNAYPALRSLEREGLLSSYEGEPLPERGGRPRRYYRITAKGRKAAARHRQAIAGLFGLE